MQGETWKTLLCYSTSRSPCSYTVSSAPVRSLHHLQHPYTTSTCAKMNHICSPFTENALPWKTGRSCFTVLSALKVSDTHCTHGHTQHRRRYVTCSCSTDSQGGITLTNVCKQAHTCSTQTHTQYTGENTWNSGLLWSRGVLKPPAPNNICCSLLLPLLSADEEGVPTRGFVNGGKSYKSHSTTGYKTLPS